MAASGRAQPDVIVHRHREAPRPVDIPYGAVVIRYGTAADIPGIAALNTLVWTQTSKSVSFGADEEAEETSRTTARLTKLMTRRDLHGTPGRGAGRLAVAECDGTIVGAARAGEARNPDAPRSLELYSIRVSSQFHGTGVARALLDLTLGTQGAYLWVGADNIRGQKFYEKCGFSPSTTTAARGDQMCLVR